MLFSLLLFVLFSHINALTETFWIVCEVICRMVVWVDSCRRYFEGFFEAGVCQAFWATLVLEELGCTTYYSLKATNLWNLLNCYMSLCRSEYKLSLNWRKQQVVLSLINSGTVLKSLQIVPYNYVCASFWVNLIKQTNFDFFQKFILKNTSF